MNIENPTGVKLFQLFQDFTKFVTNLKVEIELCLSYIFIPIFTHIIYEYVYIYLHGASKNGYESV